MVNRRLMTFLEEQELLDHRQFAFRKGLGTGIHLGCLGETVSDAIASDLHADIAILDLAKAYNTVWREGVLRQLHQWGVSGNLGCFLKQYLSDRSFRVGIGGTARPVKLAGTLIPFRKEPKILGMTIDRMTTFLPHFRQVKKDCESRKRLIRSFSSRHPKWNRRTALNINQALLHSRLFYGLEITSLNWEGSVLSPLYHGAVRLASNLLPSTPAEAACVETGVLPCRWALAVAVLKGAVGFLEKTSGDGCHLLQTAKDIHIAFTNTPLSTITQLHRVHNRAWHERGPNLDCSLAVSARTGGPPSTVRAKFLQMVERKYPNHLHIYTDGSKLSEGMGAGVSGIGEGLTLRLPSVCLVFSAEAAAIAIAITKKPEDTPAVIFSDSLSVIKALESGESKHTYVQAIEQSCDPFTTICWVSGHSGIRGNEEADRSAALGRHSRALFSKEVPSSDVIKEFKAKVSEHFMAHWRNLRGYPQVKKDLAKWTDRENRREQRALSRLRVGHTRRSPKPTPSPASIPQCARPAIQESR
ncbi:uncharacterized protein LOC131679660 [Topomyia yanbarensis]|uniref:uncharacterized protein LOC131679660 n=1 Tax=Topomyia yanbarensis TaxID=2498891 RepID=UPI00273CED56|nr:uncharacterized protein LOC131679660 [Topomyia yanbarensis]